MEKSGNIIHRTPGLYPYQEKDLQELYKRLAGAEAGRRILYQLPTGGGKTRVFAEMAKWFIATYKRNVIVLTHRIELCNQTSATLKNLGVSNRILNSSVKRLSRKDERRCYVAMVETVKNRIRDGILNPQNIGLVIIDEAHYNSFQKLLGRFSHAFIIGVTATPFSSDTSLPMHKTYHELVVGESIQNLISKGYLAKPANWRYDVELNSLITGSSGDFTISSSDVLYSSPAMLELLLHAYEANAKNKKTLIFNNGIFASRNVCQYFENAGYPIKHLDNRTTAAERTAILKWFRKTRGAILTSVSILTTGFDEPSVQAVILNRATTSITLYHQMIGRGSRRLPNKKTFTIIDLGNNTERFGEWQAPLDWQLIFNNPETLEQYMHTPQEGHAIPSDVRTKFPNTTHLAFDVQGEYQRAIEAGQKPGIVIRDSIRQHAMMCIENSETVSEAVQLTEELKPEIDWRVKQYGKCLGKVTKNYLEWLKEDYKSKLTKLVQRLKQKAV